MSKRKSTDLEVTPGPVLRRYTADESRDLVRDWLAVFSGGGAPGTSSYLWHVFSYEAYPSLSLGPAHVESELQVAPSFIVLGNSRDQAIETSVRPTECSASDCVIFPPNMAWTMAFTHEDGYLGPFFAKHRDHDKLNRQNIEAVRKLQLADEANRKKALEVEQAKKKGWL
jgi:hypothetical protein